MILLCYLEIEQAIDVPPPPTISVHPDQPLSDACAALVRTHARRLPLVDRDDQTGKETIVSVLTQYRVLKFIAINVSSCLLNSIIIFIASVEYGLLICCSRLVFCDF